MLKRPSAGVMATARRQAATPRSTAPAVSRRARANPARLPAPATHGLRGERARGQTLVADAVAFDGSPWVNALASASLGERPAARAASQVNYLLISIQTINALLVATTRYPYPREHGLARGEPQLLLKNCRRVARVHEVGK